MAETTEQLIMRMTFQGGEAERGMNAMRDKAKKDAMDYADFWKTALDKKDAAFAASAAKEEAIHKANQATLLKITEARLAKEAEAQAAIAAGSIPEGMLAGAAAGVAGKYAFNNAGKLISVEGKLVEETEKAATHMSGMSGVIREVAVVFHELISGRFKQALGSTIRLVSLAAGSTGLVMSGLVAAGLAAVVGPSALRTYRARGAEQESEKDLEKREREFVEIQRKQQERKLEIEKEIARLHEQTKREQDEDKEMGMTHSQRANYLGFQRMDILARMKDMRKDSLEYAQADADVAKLTLGITHEQADAEKEKAEKEKEHLRETYELNKQMAEELRRGQSVTDQINGIDLERPTIEQLAGRRFTSRLNRQYGAGGRYDLERGNGPFAQIAQEAELAAKQQMWDVIHGNAQFDDRGNLIGGAALGDLNRRRFAENQLAQAGFDTPAMKQAKMNEELVAINANIAELNRKASQDGIKINTNQ